MFAPSCDVRVYFISQPIDMIIYIYVIVSNIVLVISQGGQINIFTWYTWYGHLLYN